MIAAFATLVFLTALWILVVVGARVLEENGLKIVAALKGRSIAPTLTTSPMRLRLRHRERSAYRVTPRLRAAA